MPDVTGWPPSPHFGSTAVAEQLAGGGIHQMDRRACRTNDRQMSVETDLLQSCQQVLHVYAGARAPEKY
ncbi:hypothetical protein BjapCC829_06760 [Bradyrhizobium barranii]|uniref:Uncharacterized protein n=1 Tax=Bradyrhizobium barranii TaxID=2992140 RepID=A0ABY3QQS3_9BRAD|nr:hypothetical protein [Bradyrhizobium japonicum]UFW88275.1 hypothetical protein BjapCC829_06760 [Bradyrhizobium japonicum]